MENDKQVDTQTTTTEEVEIKEVEKEEVKTFNQDEVNKLVKERLDREKKKMPSKEELTKYKEWEEAKKTETEKIVEKEKMFLEKETQFNELQKENTLLKKGVVSKEIDYVLFQVSKMEGDFEENLDIFIKDNPKFINEDDTRVVKVGKEKQDELATTSSEKFKEMAIRMGLDPEKI